MYHSTNKYGILEQRVSERLNYDPKTGIITNKRNGKEAGSLNSAGYRSIGFKYEDEFYRITAHRIAWFLHYGKWPAMHINHINEIKDDNRITNLEDVSQADNNRHSRCSSKYYGVIWSKQKSKWVVKICVNGTRKYLGVFESEDEAALVYNEAVKARDGDDAVLNVVYKDVSEELLSDGK